MKKEELSGDFSVDSILEEALLKKKEASAQDIPPMPSTPAPTKEESVPEEEEDVKIYTPSTPAPRAENKEDTRVIPEIVKPQRAAAAVKVAAESELDGQMSLEAFTLAEEEKTAEEEESVISLEERLRQVRQAKVADFNFQREAEYGGFKLAGDEEENEPSEQPELPEPEEIIEDFSDYSEAEAVRSELSYRRRTGWISLTLMAAFEAILLWMTVSRALTGALPMDAGVYITLNAIFLAAMMLLGYRTVSKGISALLRLRADNDSVPAIASVVVLIQTVTMYFRIPENSAELGPMMAAAAGLGLLGASFGRQLRVLRIADNFQFVSRQQTHYTACRIDDPKTATEVGRSAVPIGVPDVAYFRKTGFLSEYLESSYEEDVSDRVMGVFVPCFTGISLLAALIFGISGHGWGNVPDLLACLLCMSMPVSVIPALQWPLRRASASLLKHGAMLTGWTAVEKFGRMQTLVVDSEILFPSNSVLLHGIKTFSGTRIDEAIMDAAALSIRAGGSLAHVFRRIIENKTDILLPVDTLVYEQDMGLSGWVGGRRVLLGNRRLMINHGIDVPSGDYERRYAVNDRELVYLSVGGELSAMFVISYVADRKIAEQLKVLIRRHITLLVRSRDPYVTDQMICRVYDVDSYYIEILSATAGRTYDQLTEDVQERDPAQLACDGGLEGMAAASAACSRLRLGGIGVTLLQAALGGIGFLIAAVMAFFSGSAVLTALSLLSLGYGAISLLLTWLLPVVWRKT